MASLKKNLILQTAYQLLAIALPLITAPYVARVLGAEKCGLYSYTNVVASYFVVFGMLGIEQYGSRCISRVRDKLEDRDKTFSELFMLHAIISILVIISYFLFALLSNTNRELFLIQGLYVISVLFDINWFFFGIEKFKVTVLRNTIIKVSCVIAIFIFVKDSRDLNVYCIIMAGATLISQVSLWPILRNYTRIRRVRLMDLRIHIKPMIMLFIAIIAANLNRTLDKVMLGWYGLFGGLGQYDYADKLVRVPLGLIAGLGTIMLSRMSYMYENESGERINKILDASAFLILVVSIGIAFCIAAVAPEFVLVYLGDGFTGTSTLLMILTISIPIVAWDNYVRTQILIPKQMDSVYTRAVCVGALTNVVLNVLFIYLWGVLGAAVSTVLSYLIIMVLQTVPVRKQINLKECFKYVRQPIIAGGLSFCLVRLGSLVFKNIFVSTLFEASIGVLAYFFFSAWFIKRTKPEVYKLLFKKKCC